MIQYLIVILHFNYDQIRQMISTFFLLKSIETTVSEKSKNLQTKFHFYPLIFITANNLRVKPHGIQVFVQKCERSQNYELKLAAKYGNVGTTYDE